MKSVLKLPKILSSLEEIFPPRTAVTGDRVGLQTGSRTMKVSGILVAHDVTPEVVARAKKKKANLIVSYHPLLFSPITSLEEERGNRVEDLIAQLVRERIALYSVHTAFDAAKQGTSDLFASALGLEHIEKLEPLEHALRKICVFVPEKFTDAVMKAMAEAGAGTIGAYDTCSFRTQGTGTFRALRGAKPFIGKKNILERAGEDKLEMIVPEWRVPQVLHAMRRAHPYEEVAHDAVVLENSIRDRGMGTIGEFPKALGLKDFIARVKRTARQRIIRASRVENINRIKRVAIVSGSGGGWMEKAQRAGADAFITGDVKYHSFADAAHNNFLVVDAGHRETERFVVSALVKRLNALATGVAVYESNEEEALKYF